jgi:hypothetical protein
MILLLLSIEMMEIKAKRAQQNGRSGWKQDSNGETLITLPNPRIKK